MPRVPVLLGADRTAKKPAWLNDPTRYHDRGDIDFGSCNETCIEQGDFFGLDDLFTERRDVVTGLADVYSRWIERYRIDGIRIDTARHVNAAFFRQWLPRIRAAAARAGVKDFLVFGEVFDADTLALYPFVRDRGLPTLLDFPLQDQLVGFAAGERGARGIASVLEDDDYFQRADGVAYTPPTFLGNHDMGRVGLLLRQRSGTDARLLDRDLLAHTLLYLLRGAPVVYYGDEVGMMGAGGDKLARQDMFRTAVAAWRTESRVGAKPIGAGSSFDVRDHPLERRLEELAGLRAEHPALATGPTAIRLASGPTLVVSRFDLASRHEYVAAFNAGTARASVTVPTATPSSAWTTLLGGTPTAQSTAAGRLTLSLAPLEAVLLRAEAALPSRARVRPALTVRPDELTALVQARATVATTEPVSVSIAVRRGSGGWTRVAADDSPPYRAYLDPRRFRRGERVQLVALARWPDGTVTTSAVVPSVPRPR